MSKWMKVLIHSEQKSLKLSKQMQVMVKAKCLLVRIKHHARNMYGEVEVQLHSLLISTLCHCTKVYSSCGYNFK
jgi:hypothetical protein